MSQEHFIKNIEIKNFKLFKDFKAKGFGRVNLIGGKNNVGKSAFMEACFIIDNFNSFYLNNHKEIDGMRERLYFEIIKSLIVIQMKTKNISDSQQKRFRRALYPKIRQRKLQLQ